MTLSVARRHARMDRIGIILSVICMVHCALIPLALALGVVSHASGVVTEAWAHLIMLVVVIPVSGLALAGGWLRHRRNDVLGWGLLGMVLLALAATIIHEQWGFVADALVTTAGGGILMYAHWQNRACSCQPGDGQPA